MTKRVIVFLHLFLLVQVALPVWYYAGRRDGNDERFAWRMFSPTRMLQCQATFTVGEPRRPVPLTSTFHEAWLELAKRGRLHVVERMAASLCERHPGEPVRVRLDCTGVGDDRRSYGGNWNMCEVGSL